MRNSIARPHSPFAANQAAIGVDATSDDRLIEWIGAGNKLAMEILFGRYQVRVYRFILRSVDNAAVAEDLTSDVFLSVWRQADRFEARSTVSTWLLAIARHKAISELRRRRDEQIDVSQVELQDPADDPETAFQKKDRGEALRHCLMQLSPDQREIIDLTYYHEKSVEEVAEIIGIPRNTVKTRMFRARRRLSEMLEGAGLVSVSA
jgi:RNA polymerase sigma-70 factor (ECF subfamily)